MTSSDAFVDIYKNVLQYKYIYENIWKKLATDCNYDIKPNVHKFTNIHIL